MATVAAGNDHQCQHPYYSLTPVSSELNGAPLPINWRQQVLAGSKVCQSLEKKPSLFETFANIQFTNSV